jgi:hypothetical protein
MSGSPREYLMIVQEPAYKTANGSPAIWTTSTTYGLANYQALFIRLDGDNSFTMRPRPVVVDNMYGGGFAVPAFKISDKMEVKGQLTCKLSVSQAPFLLSWAGVRINSGQNSPWVTTEPVGDLASCSIYHAITRSDNSVKRRVYLGCKVTSWSFAVTEDATEATLTLQITGSTPQGNQFDGSPDPTATVFPVPQDNYFAVDPFVFLFAGGSSYIEYAGATRTEFTELTLSSTNNFASRYFANRFIQMMRFMGRTTTVATKLWYPPSSQDDRTLYEGLTSESVSIELNNGTHGFTVAFNAQNVLGPFEDDLPQANLYMQPSTSANLWDAVAGNDFTLTFA